MIFLVRPSIAIFPIPINLAQEDDQAKATPRQPLQDPTQIENPQKGSEDLVCRAAGT